MQKKITVEKFDQLFDDGHDISEYIDWDSATQPRKNDICISKRINVDMPLWMVQKLDHEAKRLNIPRQSVIKTWLADRMK